jgi:hypothetical protein
VSIPVVDDFPRPGQGAINTCTIEPHSAQATGADHSARNLTLIVVDFMCYLSPKAGTSGVSARPLETLGESPGEGGESWGGFWWDSRLAIHAACALARVVGGHGRLARIFPVVFMTREGCQIPRRHKYSEIWP